jgi:hypothetical protein
MLGVMPVICVNGITASCHAQIIAERLTPPNTSPNQDPGHRTSPFLTIKGW